MKRVQAIVSGKKKQCTKVSKPDISGPVAQVDSNLPTQSSSQSVDTPSGVVKPEPRSPQPGTRRAASLETSPGVVRKGSASKIPATAAKKEGTNKPSSSPQKGRPKHDLESNSKPSKKSSKSQGLHLRMPKRPSSKDKERKAENDSAPDPSAKSVNNDAEKCLGRSNSVASNSSHKNADQGDINQNEKPADNKIQSHVPTSASEGQRTIKDKLDSEDQIQETPQKKTSSLQAMDNEPRSRQPVPTSATTNPLISPPKINNDKDDLAQPPHNSQDGRGTQKQAQTLPPPPLHGILKECKKIHNQPSTIQQQENELNEKEIQRCPQRQHCEGSSRSQQLYSQETTNQLMHGKIVGSNGHGFCPPHSHGTLPRKSALKTSVDSGHEHRYNSLPRRAHNDHEPVLSQRPNHDSNDNYNSWGSLDRKTESDSGFGALDRSFSSTGSSNFTHYAAQRSTAASSLRQMRPVNYAAPDGSNYAMIYSSGHGRPQPTYSVAHQFYHPPRPDSVPPIGSKSSLGGSGEVFYDPNRPGSVPPHNPNHAHGHLSETEAELDGYGHPYLQRGHRAGSVPLNYESEPATYGYASRNNHYDSDSGRYQRYYPPRNDRMPRGLRVHPDDERYRAGAGKKPIPRRHTLGTPRASGNIADNGRDPKTDQKREAFMQLLAQRYPQYADRIQGTGTGSPGERTASSSSASPSPQPETERPARSRDAQRRRTAVVSYDPIQAAQTLEYDDLGTMSDLELPSFQRGGFMRTSLPIVRSASTSLEKPLGLVFLVCGDQTKKSLLPNEITTLDTVRALFVRAFPDLSLEMLESPRRKIYILDPATNIYFQLEDLAEIKDRSVLKLHETDSIEPQRVKERQEVRGRTVQMAPPRPHGRQQPIYEVPGGTDIYSKPASLPPSAQPHAYQQDQWDPSSRRSRSRTPEPVERPRSLSAGASSRQRVSNSPDRMMTPGGTLNPIPENRQFLAHPAYRKDQPMPPPSVPPPLPGYYENDIYGVYGVQGNGTGHYSLPQPVLYENAGLMYHDGYAVPPALAAAAAAQQQQTYVARSTRAPPLAHAQRAVGPGPDMRDGSRSSSGRPSPAYSSPLDPVGGNYQQHRPHSHERREDASRNRIEKMEQQLATLTAWVHLQKAEEGSGMGPRRDVPPPPKSMGSLPSTASGSSETFPSSTSSSTSDVTQSHGNRALMHGSSASSVSRSDTSTPVPTMSASLEAKTRLAELRTDLQILRRQQQLNIEAIREEISSAMNQIQKVINSVPGSENKVLVHKRTQVTISKGSYLSDKQQVDKELSDLEASVEEQRNDVLSRRCRVNIVDVEGMALLLSNITKSLADLKARFPEVQSQMKEVMDAEMRVVVSEEKFLKTEPSEIERSLKRCKNLTQTLYTLKRLASAQDLQPPHIPSMAQAGVEESELTEQKHAVLESIKAMIPDHQQRVEQMEATEASRERKKKISTQQEALKFGKSLEMASKQLRPSHSSNTHSETETLNCGKIIKPSVAAKPDLVSSVQAPGLMPLTSTSSSQQALPSANPSQVQTATVSASSLSTKPYYSGALTTSATTASRVSEKPTATVSAMTSRASDSITTTAAKSPNHDPMVPTSPSQTAVKKQPSVSNDVSGGTGAVTQTVYRVQTPVSQKADADISTYQVCGPVNPVIPSSLPVATKASSLPGAGNSHSSLYGSPPGAVVDMAVKDSFENPIPAVNGVQTRKTCLSSSSSPPTSPVESKLQAGKKPSVSFAESKPIIPFSPSYKLPPDYDSQPNDHSEAAVDNRQTNTEKFDLATHKQAARNAFFSSMNTPPVSPSSPSDRSSAILDPSPVLSGVVGTLTPGSTINLVLAGSASPKSTYHPGTFTISPPADIKLASDPFGSQTSEHPKKFFIPSSTSSKKSPTLIPPRQSSLDSNLPPEGTAPLASVDTSSSSSESEYSGAKPKKVPPPPPPRRGSRPTSFSGMPCSSNNSSPTHKPGEMPRFVGGILGQHRLSGGPLSSTPKTGDYQDKPTSIFQKDIAAGIYANMNRPDLQNQKSTPQQIISKAGAERTNDCRVQGSESKEKTSNGSVARDHDNSPPSTKLESSNRQERGSSSESTSSGSSTSMGSQQSVVNVVRAQSMHSSPSSSGGTGRHGPKPAPPKRQSSLLAKFTPSSKSVDGKGVDL